MHIVRIRELGQELVRQRGMFEFRILKGDGTVPDDDGFVGLSDLK